MTKAEFDAAFPAVVSEPSPEGGNRPWSRAIASDALAVHPEQIPEAMERNRRRGLHVEYNPADGRPILKDRDQRRRLLKIESEALGRNLVDHDGGYGDG